MITIALTRLKPGMVLAEPVQNFQGILLLDTGAMLTEKSIEILKSWGVNKVIIEGESQKQKGDDLDPENKARRAVQKALAGKFKGLTSDPVMLEIMRVAGKVLEDRLIMKEEDDEKTR